MFPHVKGFLEIFISISVMVSLNGLHLIHLTVRYALDKSYDGRAEDCLEVTSDQFISTVQERGHFRFYAC